MHYTELEKGASRSMDLNQYFGVLFSSSEKLRTFKHHRLDDKVSHTDEGYFPARLNRQRLI
jgi:hypothetical protein